MMTPAFLSVALLLLVLLPGAPARKDSPESDLAESFPAESISAESNSDESISAEVKPTPNYVLTMTSFFPDCVTPFSILVSNSVTNAPNKTYSTCVVYRGILLGGMRRLQETNKGFRFTYTEDPNYGPYLQSVNGLKGSTKDRTYWELLVEKANETISLNVGIGAFIPSENDQIILNFKEY
ncbi:Cobalamin binding intrinsic factor [Dissostichus eleginoides]|uniref:Cobalamin binding intrinsic factor n=1 Tax=Dissostichus eleginoides TaxID=100907 RepID=A0AAD9CD43_DISEL|nr:Cobalamin binding intrinsic factor [Dissostichus eleginoides]